MIEWLSYVFLALSAVSLFIVALNSGYPYFSAWFSMMAVVAMLCAIETSRGWATDWVDPPDNRIIWYAIRDTALISDIDDPSSLRYYSIRLPSEIVQEVQNGTPVVQLEGEGEETNRLREHGFRSEAQIYTPLHEWMSRKNE